MAAGPEISVESPPPPTTTVVTDSVVVVDQSAPKNDSENVNLVNSNDDNNNTNTNDVESKKGSEMKVKEFVEMWSNLKLNPMAKEFFPSSYSPIDRNQPEFAINYFAQPTAYFKNYPTDNGIDVYPNNRRVYSFSSEFYKGFT